MRNLGEKIEGSCQEISKLQTITMNRGQEFQIHDYMYTTYILAYIQQYIWILSCQFKCQ